MGRNWGSVILCASLAQILPVSGLVCSISTYLGCFNDTGARVVGYLVDQGDKALTRDGCRNLCAVSGYPVLAITAHDTPTPPEGYCYCGASPNPASQRVSDSFCSVPCPGNSSETCGGPGVSWAANLTCDGPLPPAPVGPPLPAGRACSQPQAQVWPFCDHTLPIEDRVTDLVNRLTVVEIGQQLTARESPAIPRLGIPAFYWGSNAIHGLTQAACLSSSGPCPSSWPDGVGMASSWNDTSWAMMGWVTGRESRAYQNILWSNMSQPSGGLTLWGVTINLLRDPRWGRTQESVSEDPWMAGRYGASYSMGAQNGSSPSGALNPTPDPRYLLSVVTLKHFALYSLEQYGPASDPTEWERQTFNAIASPFDMWDSYFPGFQQAIQDGGAAGVMYAANEVNGVPACGSAYLDGVLHGWGFNGYRATDGGQIANMVVGHKFVPTVDQAIAYAIAAESDIADGSEYYTTLPEAYMNGNATLDGARKLAANIFRIRMRLGDFDPAPDQPYLQFKEQDIGAPDAMASVVQASREALVLLKNDNGTLPLQAGPQWSTNGSLAVIGPNCDSTAVLQGNYGGQFCHPGPHGPVTDCFPSIYGALQGSFAPGAVYAQGSGMDLADPTLLAQAVAAAQAASAIVMCLGLDQTQEREQLDRWNITLPAAQQQLLQAVAIAAGSKPLVVVLVHGGALAIPEVASGADAIIDAFYPGVTAGQPIADALFGVYNPGGKLPYTVYPPEYQDEYNFTSMDIAAARPSTDVDGQPIDWYGYSTTAWGLVPEGDREAAAMAMARASGSAQPVGRTYRYYTGQALWPFGFGLSYTTFNLSWCPPVPPAVVPLPVTSAPVPLCVTVTNTGSTAGNEVVQAYYSPVPGSFGPQEPPFLPIRQLWGFKRVHLGPGESVQVHLSLSPPTLLLTSEDGSRAPLPGSYNITVWTGYGTAMAFLVELQG